MNEERSSLLGVLSEITDTADQVGDLPADEFMILLNSPRRIQKRGFPITHEHLLKLVLHCEQGRLQLVSGSYNPPDLE